MFVNIFICYKMGEKFENGQSASSLQTIMAQAQLTTKMKGGNRGRKPKLPCMTVQLDPDAMLTVRKGL
jgi:hypothetical protein